MTLSEQYESNKRRIKMFLHMAAQHSALVGCDMSQLVASGLAAVERDDYQEVEAIGYAIMDTICAFADEHGIPMEKVPF